MAKPNMNSYRLKYNCDTYKDIFNYFVDHF